MTHERGQATVEVALLLPFAALLLLGIVQVAVVAAHQVAVTDAAREAARAAAAGGDDGVARQAALASTGLDHDRLTFEIVRNGASVQATARYLDPTDVPLIGGLLPPIHEAASAAFRTERIP